MRRRRYKWPEILTEFDAVGDDAVKIFSMDASKTFAPVHTKGGGKIQERGETILVQAVRVIIQDPNAITIHDADSFSFRPRELFTPALRGSPDEVKGFLGSGEVTLENGHLRPQVEGG